jgi:hypothetical protein
MMKTHPLKMRCQSVLRAVVLQPSAVQVMSMSALLLTPIAFLAAVLGAWRVSADLGWTNGFFVVGGCFSRYQLWFAIAVGAQTSSFLLNRAMAPNKPVPVVSRQSET